MLIWCPGKVLGTCPQGICCCPFFSMAGTFSHVTSSKGGTVSESEKNVCCRKQWTVLVLHKFPHGCNSKPICLVVKRSKVKVTVTVNYSTSESGLPSHVVFPVNRCESWGLEVSPTCFRERCALDSNLLTNHHSAAVPTWSTYCRLLMSLNIWILFDSVDCTVAVETNVTGQIS